MLTSLRKHITATTAEHYFHALSAYVIFLCTVQITTIGFSLAKMTISRGLALTILLVSLLAGYLEWHRQKRSLLQSIPEDSADLPASRAPILLTIFSIASYLLLWIVAYIRPDQSWDGNAYHIPSIHLWTLRGYVHWIVGDFQEVCLMNGYPKGVELLGFILVKAFDNSHLVNTTNLMFLPLGVLGIAYLTRALSTSSEIALFAGTAFILIPVNIYQASTTCVDSSCASCAIAFIAAVLHAQSNLSSALSIPWTVLPALGGAMGLTMSAKVSGAVLAVIGTLLLATVILFKLASTPRKRWGSFLARAILFLVLAAAIGSVVGGYWYLRNYLVTGSPLYPIGITIANHTIFPGLSVAESINLVANTPERMRSWPGLMKLLYTWLQGLWNWPSTIYGVDSRLGGLGYLWILGCVPAMLFLFYRYIRYPQSHGHRRFLLVLLAVTGIAFLSTPMNWWARYTLWIYALGLPCFAVVLDGIVGTGQRRLPIRLWALACLVVLVLEGSMCLGRVGASSYPGSWRANPLGVLHRQNWQWPVCYTFPGMSGTIFDQIFTSDAAVAVGPLKGRRKMIMGQLSLPIGHRTIIPLQENLEQDSINRILLQHVRYVIWDDGLSVPAALKQLAVRTDHVSDFWVLTLIVSPGEYVWHEGEAFLSQSGSSATDFKAPASNGQCLGMGWGSRRGDFVEYEVNLPFNLASAVLYLRYTREG